MTDAGTSRRPAVPARRAAAWGVWETAATAVLFSVPAIILQSPLSELPAQRLDGVQWAVVAWAISAAFFVTVAAKGLRGAWAFLSAGTAASMCWFVAGLWRRPDDLVRSYMPLLVTLFVACFHVLAVTVIVAQRRRALRAGRQYRLAEDRIAVGLLVCVAVFDLAPIASLFIPAGIGEPLTFILMAACLAAGGVLSALAAGRRQPARPPAGPGSDEVGGGQAGSEAGCE